MGIGKTVLKGMKRYATKPRYKGTQALWIGLGDKRCQNQRKIGA